MKLNFRAQEAESYSYGTTPLLISGSASDSTVNHCTLACKHNVSIKRDEFYMRHDPIYGRSTSTIAHHTLNKASHLGTTRVQQRGHACGFRQTTLYVLGVILVCGLPFIFPVALTQAISAVDRFGITVRRGFQHKRPSLSAMPVIASGEVIKPEQHFAEDLKIQTLSEQESIMALETRPSAAEPPDETSESVMRSDGSAVISRFLEAGRGQSAPQETREPVSVQEILRYQKFSSQLVTLTHRGPL
jgi:hypothetical protein